MIARTANDTDSDLELDQDELARILAPDSIVVTPLPMPRGFESTTKVKLGVLRKAGGPEEPLEQRLKRSLLLRST